MPDPTGVEVRFDDGVAQLVLAKPPVNSFDDDFLIAISDAVAGLPEDTRALVVSSSVDRIFAAGGDIPWMASTPLEPALEFVQRCQRTYSLFEEAVYPTIAAIEGHCLGGGMELSLACDIRILGDNAILGVPETNIGLIPGAGGLTRLPRLVGRSVAHDLLITGRRLSADEALAMNICTRRVPAGEAEGAALKLARTLADGATEAIQAAKRVAVLADQGSIYDSLDREREWWARMRVSAKSQEGLEAFAEKRKPDFRGAAERAARED